MVAELCERGILFPQEDTDALLDVCSQLKDGRAKRNALLVYRKKTVCYEL